MNSMDDFDALCAEFESDTDRCAAAIANVGESVLPGLEKLAAKLTEQADETLTPADVLAAYIMNAAIADGRVAEDELDVLYPFFERIFGSGLSHGDYEALTRRCFGGILRNVANRWMLTSSGTVSDDTRARIITVCLAVCALDGEVSRREKRWIRKLMTPEDLA